jgi:hypothetical protein
MVSTKNEAVGAAAASERADDPRRQVMFGSGIAPAAPPPMNVAMMRPVVGRRQ